MRMLDNRMDGIGSEKAIKLGKRMHDARKNAGYTIRELAELLDISPTHLNRMEKGDRLMDSIEKLILFCELCHVSIEEFLILAGMKPQEGITPIQRAFPTVTTQTEENAITAFVQIITSKKLTDANIEQMLNTALAYAEFCDKQNQ